jgi:hypothetical protein
VVKKCEGNYSLGKEKRSASHLNTNKMSPSPDCYTVDDKKIKYKNVPSFGFGSEPQRPELVSKKLKEMPGPGHYKVRSTFTTEVPKYLVQNQNEEFAAV